MKTCRRCRELKPRIEFHNKQGGKNSICKACKSEIDKESRMDEAEKEHIKYSKYWLTKAWI